MLDEAEIAQHNATKNKEAWETEMDVVDQEEYSVANSQEGRHSDVLFGCCLSLCYVTVLFGYYVTVLFLCCLSRCGVTVFSGFCAPCCAVCIAVWLTLCCQVVHGYLFTVCAGGWARFMTTVHHLPLEGYLGQCKAHFNTRSEHSFELELLTDQHTSKSVVLEMEQFDLKQFDLRFKLHSLQVRFQGKVIAQPKRVPLLR